MAANSTVKTSEDDDKHQPVILSAPLKLQYFIQIHKNLPLCSSVAKSLFGIGKNDVLSCGQLIYLYCLKETTVLNIVDSSKRHLALPINTSVVFTPLYNVKQASSFVAFMQNSFDLIRTVSFSSTRKLLDAQPRPKVVAVEKCGLNSKFTIGEILVISEFSENSFLCYSLLQQVQKHVYSTSEADSQIGFTTEVSMVQMEIKDVADYVSLPIKGLLHFEDTRLQQLFSNVCEITSVGIRKSVLASFQPPAATGNILKHLVEIYTSSPISLQIVEVVNEEDNRLMLQHSRKILSDFSPFCIDDVVIDVAAACPALQERLYHSSLTTQEHWRNGVKLFISSIMETATSANKNGPHLTGEKAEIESHVKTVNFSRKDNICVKSDSELVKRKNSSSQSINNPHKVSKARNFSLHPNSQKPLAQHIYDSIDDTDPIIQEHSAQKNYKNFVADDYALPTVSQQQPHLFQNPGYTTTLKNSSAENSPALKENAQIKCDTVEEIKPIVKAQVLQTTSPTTTKPNQSIDNARINEGPANDKSKCVRKKQSSRKDMLITKKNSVEDVSHNMAATSYSSDTQQAQPKKKSKPSVSKKLKMSETSEPFVPTQFDPTASKIKTGAKVFIPPTIERKTPSADTNGSQLTGQKNSEIKLSDVRTVNQKKRLPKQHIYESIDEIDSIVQENTDQSSCKTFVDECHTLPMLDTASQQQPHLFQNPSYAATLKSSSAENSPALKEDAQVECDTVEQIKPFIEVQQVLQTTSPATTKPNHSIDNAQINETSAKNKSIGKKQSSMEDTLITQMNSIENISHNMEATSYSPETQQAQPARKKSKPMSINKKPKMSETFKPFVPQLDQTGSKSETGVNNLAMETTIPSAGKNGSRFSGKNSEIASDVQTLNLKKRPHRQHIYESIDEVDLIVQEITVQKNCETTAAECHALPMLDTAEQPHLCFQNPSYETTLKNSAENASVKESTRVECDSIICENKEIKPFVKVLVLPTTSPTSATVKPNNSLDKDQINENPAEDNSKCEKQNSMENTLIKKNNSIAEDVSQNMVATNNSSETQQPKPKKKSKPSVSKKPKLRETFHPFVSQFDQTASNSKTGVFIPPTTKRKTPSANANGSQLLTGRKNSEIKIDVQTVNPKKRPPKQHIYESIDEIDSIVQENTDQSSCKTFVDESRALPILATAPQQQPYLFQNPSYAATLINSSGENLLALKRDNAQIKCDTVEEIKPIVKAQVLQTTSPTTTKPNHSIDNARINESPAKDKSKCILKKQISMENTVISKRISTEDVSQNMVITSYSSDTQQAQPKKKSKPFVSNSNKPKMSDLSAKPFVRPQLDQTGSKNSAADEVDNSHHVLINRIEELAQQIELMKTIFLGHYKVEKKYNTVFEVMNESTHNQMMQQQEYTHCDERGSSDDVVSDTGYGVMNLDSSGKTDSATTSSHVSLPVDISLLTVKEVQALLEDNHLGQYKQKFAEELINGRMLLQLDDELLKNELNVEVNLHRLRLLQIIATAKE